MVILIKCSGTVLEILSRGLFFSCTFDYICIHIFYFMAGTVLGVGGGEETNVGKLQVSEGSS